MPRGSVLHANEGTKALRIRAPKRILQRLERLTPAQLGAWVYFANECAIKHEPEHSLEHVPPAIPEAALQEKPIHPKLAEILKAPKVQPWERLGASMAWTEEERLADEAFWQEREEERQREREALMRELEAEKT
jgi:hypothetical protein